MTEPNTLKRDFRNFLYVVWKWLNLPDPTPVQYDIAHYLQHGPIFVPFDSPDRIVKSLATVLQERAEGLVIQGGPVAYVHTRNLVDFSAENRLPAIYPFREAVEAGGLISYGPSVTGIFRQLAGFADRILKGSRPADMPVEQPTEYEMIVHAAVARELGLTIPETILARADEVIE